MEKSSTDLKQPNFKRLMKYTKLYQKGLIVAVLGMLGYAGIDAFLISQLQPLIDEGLTGANPDFMTYAPLFVIILLGFRGIFHFIGNYSLSWVGNNVVANLRQNLFEHIIKMPVSYHDTESTGTLISKITFDAEQVLSATSKALSTIVQQGAFVAFLLGVMFYNSWQLSLIFLLVMPVIAVVVQFVSKRFRKVSSGIQNAMGEVTSAAEQTFSGHKVVLTFGGQERENKRFAKINKHNRQQRMKMVAAQTASVPFIQLIASFGLAFVLYFANLDFMKDSITPGAFATVLTSLITLLKPIKQLTSVNAEFQRGMAACESIFAVLDQEIEKDTGTKALTKSKGIIEFNNVSFQYPGEEVQALENINIKANQGETIALVGRSGSGKTTASSMALRFYEPSSGEILIDGENILNYRLKDLRHQFAYVSQQVVLFNDTLANNIAYGKPDATDDEILAAAKSAHVWEFAQKLPEGINTNIGNNGAMLSGGQRQRVAIARAILCDAPFLILDEATSALDTESERHIQDALQKLQSNRTSIVIAHRLSTIESADKIIVMEQGKIVEQGSHQNLLDKNGMYAQLHKLQFG
jgi:subfamily B ATP-binding cassette protein MsbA